MDILVAMAGNRVGDTRCGILEPKWGFVKIEHGQKGEMKS